MKKKKHEEEDWRKCKDENQNQNKQRRQRPEKIQRRHDCCCLGYYLDSNVIVWVRF